MRPLLEFRAGRFEARQSRIALLGSRKALRSAFTLIELLIVVTISLILLAATAATFNYSLNADRVRSTARQFQSFLAGARDKAIHANDIRGVRLLLDPNNNHTVSGMQYIGSPQQETSQNGTGALQLDPNDTNGYTVMLPSTSGANRWKLLKSQGYLQVGCRIQIPNATGPWFTVAALGVDPTVVAPAVVSAFNPKLILSRPVAGLIGGSIPAGFTGPGSGYVLELGPSILGDAQPVLFPRGVVIDLDGSNLPAVWRPLIGYVGGVSQSYSPQMDILFSPRGTIVGDCAGMGMVHLHFADGGEVVNWNASPLLNGRNPTYYNTATYPLPVVPANNLNVAPPINILTKDRILATLAPLTGNVGVYYVNEAIVSTNTTTPIASDPYSFAETGRVANK